jgi:hypothetical protein
MSAKLTLWAGEPDDAPAIRVKNLPHSYKFWLIARGVFWGVA